jgi:hypothetical protein
MKRSVLLLAALSGCAPSQARFAPAETSLKLSRVVLYRNGVGYFERAGGVSGQVLSIRCRKDQINDVLKSLTVVDRRTGQAVSVSMPLDPQRWASAAMALLTPGQGNLARILDSLRGSALELHTRGGTLRGRLLLVEEVPKGDDKDGRPDQRVSVIDGDQVRVTLLSRVTGLRFHDAGVAMQLHRSLDATAGEGMFKQVAVSVRLTGPAEHDLSLSYVVSAPVWQPTYRIVLPDNDKDQDKDKTGGEALLQGWAVVGNTSGEDWTDVRLSLTSGAPIAFRYDLHTPRDVQRRDMTSTAFARQAEVAMGEATLEEEQAAPAAEGAAEPMERARASTGPGGGGYSAAAPDRPMKKAKAKESSRRGRSVDADEAPDDAFGGAPASAAPPPPPSSPSGAVDFNALRQSTQANVQARRVSGLTQFDLDARVTVPDGSSTMVAILNRTVPAEQAFLYRPGGSGPGFEANPYRVVRFKNNTPFVLEPGPISIYSGGSFVGEGISEAIATDTSATIPFAVEPGIAVSSSVSANTGEVRVLRISGGTLTLESFHRHVTKWTVRGAKQARAYKVLVRHARRGGSFELRPRPPGVEDLPDAYLVPIPVSAGQTEANVEVVEQTPVRSSISIWDPQAEGALGGLLAMSNVDEGVRRRLQPVLELRREIAQIDTQLEGLRRQQQALDQRASETRANLEAIKKDPRAAALRERLSQRLEEFTKEGDGLGRRLVELNSKRLEKKINLDEMLQRFEYRAP